MNEKKSKILIAVFLGIFTLISVAMVIPQEPTQVSQSLFDYNQNDPQISFGEPKAVLIEYSDFQCPYCALVDQTIIAPVLEKKLSGLTVVFKHLPLKSIHPNAVISAVASEAAHIQGKFFEYKELLYENQDEWSYLSDPKPTFIAYAKAIGLDENKFINDLNSSALQEKIENAYTFGIENGLNSTPSLFLNGEKISVRTPEELEKLILSELSEQ